jgi:hypothetical protein
VIGLALSVLVGGAALVVMGCDRSAPAAPREPTAPVAQREPTAPVAPQGASSSAPPGATGKLPAAVPAADLCVTSGVLGSAGGELAVESPSFRATLARSGDKVTDAELRFTYLGPTASVAQLGSGRIRRQIGLKLRAQDPCNLIYAMWRIDPGPELAVQVKRNPGLRTSAECKNGGYRTVRPARSAPVGPVAEGSTHVLRAALRGSTLDVWADGVLVWEGALADDALTLEGPVGLRSDNARFTFALSAAGPRGLPGAPRPCTAGEPGD